MQCKGCALYGGNHRGSLGAAAEAHSPDARASALPAHPYRLMVNLLLKCITKIPICGGWCDTTISPETTALRQFSNEKTVPQPCLRGPGCRSFWEHNAVCRVAAGFGLPCADRNRAAIMITACVFSSIGWLLMLVSNLGLAQSDAVVEAVPWARASVEESWGEATVSIGIRRRSHHVDISYGGASYAEDGGHDWSDDAACSRPDGAIRYSEPPLNVSCSSCGDAADQITFFVAMSLLTQIIQVADPRRNSCQAPPLMLPSGQERASRLGELATGATGPLPPVAGPPPHVGLMCGLPHCLHNSRLPGGDRPAARDAVRRRQLPARDGHPHELVRPLLRAPLDARLCRLVLARAARALRGRRQRRPGAPLSRLPLRLSSRPTPAWPCPHVDTLPAPRPHMGARAPNYLPLLRAQVELSLDMEWQPGAGYLCMLVGVLLKSVDVVCHLLVPTPAPKRRQLAPGERYGTLAEYLRAKCPEPTRVGRPVAGAADGEKSSEVPEV